MRIEKLWLAVLASSIAIKFGLMWLAIGGFDFGYIFQAVSYSFKGRGYETAPWIWFIGLLYRFWLYLPLNHSGVEETLLRGEGMPLGFEGSLLVFLLKLPLLILDIVCGIVLAIFAKKLGVKGGLKVLAIWMLNPYVTLFVEMGGSMDVLPALLTVLSVLLFIQSKFKRSYLVLAAGTGIRLYSVLVVPMLVVFTKRMRHAFGVIVASLAGAVIYFYWVWSIGWNPLFSLLNYSSITFNISEFMLTPYDSRIGLATMAAFIYGFLVYRFWDLSENNVLPAVTGFLLAYFAFLNWWPGYLLTLISFMMLHSYSTKSSRRIYIILILLAFIFELSAFDFGFKRYLFFIPFYFNWMKIVAEALQLWSTHVVVKLVVEPILRSAFATVSLYQAGCLLIQNSSKLSNILRRSKYA